MRTKFDIDQKVLLKAEIDEIRINSDGTIVYRIWINYNDLEDDTPVGLYFNVFEHALTEHCSHGEEKDKGGVNETTNSKE